MHVTFKGRKYAVTYYSMKKPGLTGVTVDGAHIGNFRTEEQAYRYQMAEQAERFPLSLSLEEVAAKVATLWLLDREEKKRKGR